MPFFKSADNCQLYYECHDFKNERPVVVFLNGTTQTTKTWGLQVRHLKNNFRILLYDARGQGQSELGQTDLALDGHVNDLILLLDYLCVNRTHLVGLSHGARVACRFGAIAAERTDRMVLCGLGRNLSPRTAALLNSWNHILDSSSLETLAWSMLPIVFGEPFIEQHKSILNEMVSVIVKRNRTDAVKAHKAKRSWTQSEYGSTRSIQSGNSPVPVRNKVIDYHIHDLINKYPVNNHNYFYMLESKIYRYRMSVYIAR